MHFVKINVENTHNYWWERTFHPRYVFVFFHCGIILIDYYVAILITLWEFCHACRINDIVCLGTSCVPCIASKLIVSRNPCWHIWPNSRINREEYLHCCNTWWFLRKVRCVSTWGRVEDVRVFEPKSEKTCKRTAIPYKTFVSTAPEKIFRPISRHSAINMGLSSRFNLQELLKAVVPLIDY